MVASPRCPTPSRATRGLQRGASSGDGVRMDDDVIDPREEARTRLGGGFDVRVLEPSPPAVVDDHWFADDPVHAPVARDVQVVSAVRDADVDVTWDDLAADSAMLAAWCADRWLGAWRALGPINDVDALERTRRGLHAVAERALAPARQRVNGKIGLRFSRDGFGTPWFVADGNAVQVRVAGTTVVVAHERGVEHIELRATDPTALRAATGAPEQVDLGYNLETTLDADALAGIDAVSAARLADWFGFGCSVLEELRAREPDAGDTRCQLWPEHFDLSVELGDVDRGWRATYGASPGDAEHPEPYLYVSPWSGHGADPYWNDTAFPGSSLPYTALTGDARAARAAALEFFRTGQALLTG